MNLDLLRTAKDRGIRLNLDPNLIPTRYLDGGKKQEKMNRLLDRLRDQQDENGRVHPHYHIGKTGRIHCKGPNILTLPFDFIEGTPGLLDDVSIMGLEVLVAAKLLKIPQLYELMLDNPMTHVADLLPRLDAIKAGFHCDPGTPEWKTMRQYLKLAIYKTLYGVVTSADDGPEAARFQTLLIQTFPSLPTPRGKLETTEQNEARKAFIRQIHVSCTALIMAVADLVENTEGCQVVGFFHDEVLVEYDGDDPEAQAERFRLLTYDMLRSWQGEPMTPFSHLQEV